MQAIIEMRILRGSALTAIFLWLATPIAAAQPLTVAAAADLQAALPTLVDKFQQESGHKVTLTFGSSGNFFTQTRNGAPFDLFLSADIDYPRQLERAGLAEPGTWTPMRPVASSSGHDTIRASTFAPA